MSDPLSAPPIQRPLGLWVLSSFALLIDGLFPLVLVFLYAGTPSMPLLNAILVAGVAIAVVLSSLAAFRAASWARLGLPVAVGLYHLMIGYTSGRVLLIDGAPSDLSVQLAGRVVRSLIIPIIYFWYFTRSDTIAFFNNPRLHPSEQPETE
jgi:hypothetical protein